MAEGRSPPAIDIEKAALDPSSAFETPEDVLTNDALA